MEMSEHTSKQFDVDLENIRTKVLQMGGLVEQQVERAMDGLASGEVFVIDQVIANDHRVNLLEVELDEACSHVIARRQPAASDLRMIMAVIKTITDLERIGDEAKKIAKMAKRIHEADAGFVPRIEMRHAAGLAANMLHKALDAFARLDVHAAAGVVREDAEVDREFKAIMRQLITFMIEDPRTISSSIEILFIAKSIERIGDHAKNMSEYVIYLVKGRDVRHTGVDEIVREAST
ncbi:MAG: phosphate signaling complex protein PhoU [Sterolibacteriaceae bacterium]|nr:phosphate signaling complex protein PhoU [Sterolibacteriaceae bacterium]MBK9086053.1 phosphate signaling complex protein PhoU [Sterolibacteriaceae bacterium]